MTDHHPIRIVVSDDLRRSRVTVFFRLVLVIPHLIWGAIFSSVVYGEWDVAREAREAAAAGAVGAIFLAWLVTLFSRRLWDELHGFFIRFLRWSTHITAYLTLLADPYPRFDGRRGYPIDLEVDAPELQNRWTVFFRLILAIPAIVFSVVLAVVLFVLAVAGWFVSLIVGRLPGGMRDLGVYCLRFGQQTTAYLLLLTPRYPSLSGPAGTPEPPAPPPESA